MGSQLELRLLRVSQPRDCCFEQMFVSVSAGLRTSPVCLFIVVPSKFCRFHSFFFIWVCLQIGYPGYRFFISVKVAI